MHKQYSRLVQVKASKRLGSDQLESNNSPGEVLFNYLQFEFGTGNPYYRPSRARTSESTLIMRITRLAWKILTTSCHSMNNPDTQKGYLFEDFRGGTCKFT